MEVLGVDEVGRRLLEELKREAGLPKNAPAYLVWGANPQELRATLDRFIREEPLTAHHRCILQSVLPELERRGFNLVALVPFGEKVYVRGAKVPVMVPLQG